MIINFDDRVVLGAIAGIVGVLTRDIYSFFAKAIGLAKFTVWNIAAALFMRMDQVKTPVGNIVGILADTVMGAIIGVLFVYFLKCTNTKNIILKGWGIGLAAWLLLFGVIYHTLPFGVEAAPKDALSNLSAFLGHSILGFGLGITADLLLKKYEYR